MRRRQLLQGAPRRRSAHRRGHKVLTPTLTGLGARSHLLNDSIDLGTHVADIVNFIKWESLTGVVLCGHSYGGMVAPAGTPREVVARLNAEVNKALARPDVREKLTAQCYDTAGGTPEQFAEVIRRDIARYSNVVRDAHIRPD